MRQKLTACQTHLQLYIDEERQKRNHAKGTSARNIFQLVAFQDCGQDEEYDVKGDSAHSTQSERVAERFTVIDVTHILNGRILKMCNDIVLHVL